MFELVNKVAIVTGAGKGIGKAIALGLAEAGASVVLCARSNAEIEANAAEIQGKSGAALALTADTRNVNQVRNLLQETLARFGKVDILVNNAGGGVGALVDILEMPFEDWERSIEQTLNSVFICIKIVGEQMAKQKAGNIINIASIVGMGPYGTLAHYSAAKAGVINLTQNLGVLWARHNIRINAIAPGYIETPLTTGRRFRQPGALESILRRIPLQRLGKPEDTVGAVLYLASDASAYVTGQTIVVSGGLSNLIPADYRD